MKTLHHTYVKKAAKMGVQLTLENNRVRAFWPERNFEIFAADGREALEYIQGVQNTTMANEASDGSWENTGKREVPPQFVEDPPPTINTVPTSGRAAHRKGIHITECPFAEDTPEYIKWNEDWEASAEEALTSVSDEGEKKPASVVKPKYRAIYAELGHPTTCGDELAEKIDNLVKNAKGTNIEYLLRIADANEVNYSKYNMTNPGWQGRIRMTVRNMLAKKVHANGGVLKLPDTTELRMSADWMSSQRFQR